MEQPQFSTKPRFLNKPRFARWAALMAGLGALAIAGFHFPLPEKLHWRETIGEPTVGWGIEMLNFALSDLMLICGVLTAWAAYRLETNAPVARMIIGVTGCYWVGNAVFQFINPMPLPEFLAFIRWVLIGFAIVMASLHLIALALSTGAKAVQPGFPGRMPLLVAFLVVLVPAGSWASAQYLTPWPKVRTPSATTTAIPQASSTKAEEFLLPDLGLPPLDEVTDAAELHIADLDKNIPQEMYLAAWPWLTGALAALNDGRVAEGRWLLEEFLRDPSRRHAATNVLAGIDRRNGDLLVARQRMDGVLAKDDGHVLHDYQDALCRFASMMASESAMEKWALSRKVQNAYQRVFDARPETSAARLYLIGCLEMTPAAVGGDPTRAYAMANQAIEADDHSFLLIRAWLNTRREKFVEALADYDLSVRRGIFEDAAFLTAIRLALSQKDMDRAKRYVAYAVAVNGHSAGVMEAAGDYFSAAENNKNARLAYDAALQLAPQRKSVGEKLEALGKG